MSIKISHATSVSNSAFRVVCGEIMLDNSIVSHHEALFGTVTSGSAVIQIADSTHTLRKGDVYFVAPNVKYNFKDYSDAEIEVVTLNFANPAAVTQDYMPQGIIRALINGNCTPFAMVSPNEEVYTQMYDAIQNIKAAETEKYDGIILNAGAYSHSSYSIRDAVAAISLPIVMVHISNVYARENFRHENIIAAKCKGVITGLGLKSYELAVMSFAG